MVQVDPGAPSQLIADELPARGASWTWGRDRGNGCVAGERGVVVAADFEPVALTLNRERHATTTSSCATLVGSRSTMHRSTPCCA